MSVSDPGDAETRQSASAPDGGDNPPTSMTPAPTGSAGVHGAQEGSYNAPPDQQTEGSPALSPMAVPSPTPPATAVPPQQAAAPSAVPESPSVRYVRAAVLSQGGLRTLAWLLGAALVVGFAGSLCLVIPLAVSGIPLDFGSFIGGLLVGVGIMFGAGVAFSATGSAGLVSATGSVSLTILSLTALAVLSAVVVLVLRMRASAEGERAPGAGAELLRAAVEGAVVAVLVTLLVAFARVGTGAMGVEAELRARAGFVLLLVFVVVAATLFSARELRRRRELGKLAGPWLTAAKEGGLLCGVQFAVFGLVTMVVLVVFAVRLESPQVFFVMLPFIGNVSVFAIGLGHLGGAVLGGSAGVLGSASATAMAWDLGEGGGAWIFVATLIAMAVGASVIGVRRQRLTGIRWGRVWRMPVLVFAVWCLLSLGLAGVSGGGELSALSSFAGGGGTLSLSWWTPFLLGTTGFLVSLGAESAALIAYRISPKLLVLLGGRTLANVWLLGAAPAGPAAAPVPVKPGGFVPASAPHTAPTAAGPEPEPHASVGPQPAQSVAAEPIAPPTPMSPRAKTALLVTLCTVGVVAVLAAVGAVTVSILNAQRDPSHQVREYLELLAEGEAESATAMVDPGIPNAERVLLTDEVLQAADHRIEVVDVKTTDRGDESASVTATIGLDGERFEHVFAVEQGAKEFLFLDTWQLSEPLLVTATLSAEGAPEDSVVVGETRLALDGGDDAYVVQASRQVYLYPGIYTVALPANEYVESASEVLKATPDQSAFGSAEASLVARPSDAFTDEILAQVQQRVTQCAEVPTNTDDACPYEAQQRDLASLEVLTQAEGFEEITLSSFRSTEATLQLRRNPSLFNDDPEPFDVEFSLNGSIEFENGKPVVTEFDTGWW